MDRRDFLVASGLAVAAPVLAPTAGAVAGVRLPGQSPPTVNFRSDGLGLSPADYADLLAAATRRESLSADNYSNGGEIAELERKFAQLLGKPAAIFLPTGTMANHLAVRRLAGGDRRVLVQAESHLYNDTGDGAQALSGLNLIPLGVGQATVRLDEVRAWVERSAGGRVESRVGVISIESPVRRRDHEYVEFGELERISQYARESGIRLHLDGARLFNLPLHTGRSIHEHTALFDTVFVSLWKHFNAAYGAILAGEADFIEGLYHVRRMFGGSLPQAWPGVAVAADFVDDYPGQYARSWHAADELITRLRANGGFDAKKFDRGTSRFLLSVPGVEPERFAERLASAGVLLPHAHPETGMFALQVNPTLLRVAPDVLARAFLEARGSP